jgi:hypothetical protein
VREQAEAPLALLAADGSRKYVGAAIGLNRAIRKRLWEAPPACPAGRQREYRSRSTTLNGSSRAWSGMSAIWKARAACGAL